jgi:hypothetical protein
MALHRAWPLSPVEIAAFDENQLTEDDLRCGYSSKKCTNVRTTKKGGGLHRFCEFHRRRANQNQWRVDDKRRGIRAQRRQMLKRARVLALPDPVGLLDAGASPTTEDIQLLQALLLSDNRKGVATAEAMATFPGAGVDHATPHEAQFKMMLEDLQGPQCIV